MAWEHAHRDMLHPHHHVLARYLLIACKYETKAWSRVGTHVAMNGKSDAANLNDMLGGVLPCAVDMMRCFLI